jgi:hypothetical protein
MKASRLLPIVEAILVGWAGAALGFVTGLLAGGIFAVPFALVAGMNGVVSGARGVYDWRAAKGWLAFVADSSWGLLGTLGSVLVHTVNAFRRAAQYEPSLSRRRNRHVYGRGFALKPTLAFTQGNVISNARQGRRAIVESFVDNHEGLHVWQGRLFGPLFQVVYGVWFPLGALVGFAVWLRDRREPLKSLVETAAYYNNPFEYWAYRNDDYWPPIHAHSKLHWGRASPSCSPLDRDGNEGTSDPRH